MFLQCLLKLSAAEIFILFTIGKVFFKVPVDINRNASQLCRIQDLNYFSGILWINFNLECITRETVDTQIYLEG